MGPYEYIVETIAGDYATLLRTDLPAPGEPMPIAVALLPEGTDIGTRLHWENFAYPIVD